MRWQRFAALCRAERAVGAAPSARSPHANVLRTFDFCLLGADPKGKEAVVRRKVILLVRFSGVH